jgi:hypothetical protein
MRRPHDRIGDREPESGALTAVVLDSVEPVEQPWPLGDWNARSVVGDRQCNLPSAAVDADSDPPR